MVYGRGGVLEDVVGLEDVLEDTFESLALKPQVFENCPVLGSRTALFLNRWNFVGKRQKPCRKSAKTYYLVSSSRDRLKKNFWRPFSPEKIFEDLFFSFFWRTLASVSLVLGLGLERVCPWPRNFFLSLALASSLVSSPPPLVYGIRNIFQKNDVRTT